MIIRDPAAIETRMRRWRSLYDSNGLLFAAHLDITYRCDLDCTHCYLDDKNNWPELKTAEWLDILEQLSELQAVRLTWSGGEVFARPDFPQLLERARELGFLSSVKTHAGNIDAERAAWLYKQDVGTLEVSVYSLYDAVHDAVTQVPGSLAATLTGIDNALAAGLDVRINCSVFRANLDELEEMGAHFQQLGARFSIDANIFPDHKATPVSSDLLLTPDEYQRAVQANRRIRLARGEDPAAPDALDADGRPCGAGSSGIYIAPDGAVWPCVSFPIEAGHVRRQRLADIWVESPQFADIRQFNNGERAQCMSCGGGGDCFFCMGDAFKRTGDFRKAPPLFHARTRLVMEGANAVTPGLYDADALASVPRPSADAPTAASGRPRKFQFPIYRPTRNAGPKGGKR